MKSARSPSCSFVVGCAFWWETLRMVDGRNLRSAGSIYSLFLNQPQRGLSKMRTKKEMGGDGHVWWFI